ncbi:MAG: 3-dehydroquinate synthase, partial [Alphaproteobacteria bacterium]
GADMIAAAGQAIQAVAPDARCAIITDENVAGLHLHTLALSLIKAGVSFSEFVLPPGEDTKSFSRLTDLSNTLLDNEFERGDVIVAFGGGVIGDLAGFAASILKRGVRLVQIPTTLLSQVDSSVGGKTGINTRHGKNLIGTFHQPSLVVIDTDVLTTLNPREFRAGYAEVVKYGVLGNAEFFAWLEENVTHIFSANTIDARLHAIEQCCQAKAELVIEDERETGRRALLNLGHTFGHALEAWAGYSARLKHGEGVAIGMVLAAELSEEMGLCEKGVSQRIAAHLRAAELPSSIADLAALSGGEIPSAHEIMSLMSQDKKTKGGHVTFILLRGIGEAFVSDTVDPENLQAFLETRCRV